MSVHSQAAGSRRAPGAAPQAREFRTDVIGGLSGTARSLPCKYFYDARGARLFDRICELDAYYPTRAERSILEKHGDEIAGRIGRGACIIEFGSGSAVKSELLLERLMDPAAYMPVDISHEQLIATAGRLARRFPSLHVVPVHADYTRPFDLPRSPAEALRTVVFFPGSTIGNFEPPEAVGFLQRMGSMAGPGGAVLVGVDRRKDRATLELAYNDPEGITAEFNRNLLVRISNELGANIDVDCFAHRAIYDEGAGRIEMHLVSTCDQIIRIPGEDGAPSFLVAFREGEHIVTEHSYKYTPEGVAELAGRARLRVDGDWSDDEGLFGLYLLHAE